MTDNKVFSILFEDVLRVCRRVWPSSLELPRSFPCLTMYLSNHPFGIEVASFPQNTAVSIMLYNALQDENVFLVHLVVGTS